MKKMIVKSDNLIDYEEEFLGRKILEAPISPTPWYT